MKMQDAMNIMEAGPAGFMVTFEKVRGSILESDHFPDVRNGEPPIATEEEAWQMAAQFAAKTRTRCVNIYAIRRKDFTPVPRYRERMIENR
jgi:hypothetical protein